MTECPMCGSEMKDVIIESHCKNKVCGESVHNIIQVLLGAEERQEEKYKGVVEAAKRASRWMPFSKDNMRADCVDSRDLREALKKLEENG